jgi:hypothetical protein
MEFPGVIFEPSSRVPVLVVTIEPVEKIEHGIPASFFVFGRKENPISHIALERCAVKLRIPDDGPFVLRFGVRFCNRMSRNQCLSVCEIAGETLRPK